MWPMGVPSGAPQLLVSPNQDGWGYHHDGWTAVAKIAGKDTIFTLSQAPKRACQIMHICAKLIFLHQTMRQSLRNI